MFSIDSLMGMICTEAIEEDVFGDSPSYRKRESRRNLPPINYPLRLERDSNGRVYWAED